MKRLLALFLLLIPASAAAHPGVGIVQDAHGNVFYTDLTQVWKIAPDGRKTVAVPNVHTHELCLDLAGNLYGEHLWFDSGRDKWFHRVWTMTPDGRVRDVIPAREGFLSDFGFVRDRNDTMYWADRGAQTVIKKRTPNGPIVTHATGDFRSVHWMTALPDGTLFLMDAGDLRRVSTSGAVTTIARRLTSRTPVPSDLADLNYHMGVWTDNAGRVYVAIGREGVVMRVGSTGGPQVVARSTAPWSVSGGMVDRQGNLWLLEYDTSNAVRVRKLDGAAR